MEKMGVLNRITESSQNHRIITESQNHRMVGVGSLMGMIFDVSTNSQRESKKASS